MDNQIGNMTRQVACDLRTSRVQVFVDTDLNLRLELAKALLEAAIPFLTGMQGEYHYGTNPTRPSAQRYPAIPTRGNNHSPADRSTLIRYEAHLTEPPSSQAKVGGSTHVWAFGYHRCHRVTWIDDPYLRLFWAWIGTLILLAGFATVAGHGILGLWTGLLIDDGTR